MFDRIGERLNYYKFPAGARTYALRQTAELEPVKQKPDILKHVEKGVDANVKAVGVNMRWRQRERKESIHRSGAGEVDAQIDGTLSDIHGIVERFGRATLESKKKRMAVEFDSEFFPEGVYPITSLQYVEQHEAVNHLLERIEAGWTDHVKTLNLVEEVEQLAQLNETYGELLDTTAAEGLTFEQVRRVRREGEDAFHRAIFALFAGFMGDKETLHQVLEPIEIQNERLRQYYRSRSAAPKVDPDSGEILDEDEESSEEDVDEPTPV